MFRITWLSSLVMASALSAAPSGEETTANPEEAESLRKRSFELLDRLGSPSYRARNEAAGQLLRMGRDALAALSVGKDDPNPEIRLRCERLYPIIERIDLNARIDAFLADPSGEHDLPGLARFLDVVGDGEAARGLYTEMIRAEGPLIELAESEGGRTLRRYQQRVQEVQDRFNSGVRVVNGKRVPAVIPEPEMAALLFVGASEGLEGNDQSHNILSGLFYRTEFQTVLRGDDAPAPELRKLFLNWLAKRSRDYAAYQGFYVVLRLDMKEALPVAREVVADKAASTQARGMAAMAVGKFGSEDDLPMLAKLLDDETVLTNVRVNNVQGTTQLRDVALAMSVQLAGQQHKDYPFDLLQGNLNFQMYYNLGFTSDEKRKEAFEKWAESRKKK